MAQQKIELRKIRDFSENLNDTFVFIRQNLKPLLISFLGIAGVFMLTAAIINGIYQSEASGVFQKFFRGRIGSDDSFSLQSQIFSPTYFLIFLSAWLNMTAMKTTLIAYMKVYERNHGEKPEMAEIWNEFKKYYFKVLIYSVPIVLLIIVGCFFCLAPGIYLYTVLVPFEIMLVMEDATFGGAWNKCFTIIKENFWMSLGIYIIAYLIYSFSSSIIGLFIGIITGLLAYFTTKNISSTIGMVTSVFNILSFLFFIIYYVSAILNYFSLTERYDGTGMMNRLDNLGTSAPTFNNTQEEY